MTQFVIGVDIGGTFTDAIVVADAGQVSLVGERGKVFLGCVSCGKKLGVAEDGYRHGCLELEIALETISPNFLSPKKRLMKTFFFDAFSVRAAVVLWTGRFAVRLMFPIVM